MVCSGSCQAYSSIGKSFTRKTGKMKVSSGRSLVQRVCADPVMRILVKSKYRWGKITMDESKSGAKEKRTKMENR